MGSMIGPTAFLGMGLWRPLPFLLFLLYDSDSDFRVSLPHRVRLLLRSEMRIQHVRLTYPKHTADPVRVVSVRLLCDAGRRGISSIAPFASPSRGRIGGRNAAIKHLRDSSDPHDPPLSAREKAHFQGKHVFHSNTP